MAPSEDSFGRWRALIEQNLCLRQFLVIIEVFAVYIRLCRDNPDCFICINEEKVHTWTDGFSKPKAKVSVA
jgi:hypothetical protein